MVRDFLMMLLVSTLITLLIIFDAQVVPIPGIVLLIAFFGLGALCATMSHPR